MVVLFSANAGFELVARKNIIKSLQKLNYNVIAVGIFDDYARSLQENLGIKFINIKVTPRGTNPITDLKLLKIYRKIYEKISPSIVLHFGSKPSIYGSMAANQLGIPNISNITGLGTAFLKKNILTFIVEKLYKIAFNSKKNFVFFQNQDDKNLFLQYKIVKTEQCDVLPGSGVDLNYFTQSKEEKKALNENIEFAFIGRLVLSKGIREYIVAATEVKKEFPYCNFHIAGKSRDGDIDFIKISEIEEAEQNEIIKYHGYVKDIKKFLQEQVDCLVYPSYYREGVPRVLLEGAAMSKPLIGADSIGTKEPIEHNKNGFLVQKKDATDLKQKIIDFINLPINEKIKMGQASRAIAEERFSDEIIVEKYLSKIKEMT